MTATAVHGSEGTQQPKIHYFGAVASTFDEAWRLYENGEFSEWDSVIAKSQMCGRGQLRKHWISPPGNLYWTVRLPRIEPFDSSAAPVALGALVTNALCELGCQALLKWPNDVVARTRQGIAKVAGILLEERAGCIMAGIGINVSKAPGASELGGEEALPATTLAICAPAGLPSASQLGQRILRHIRSSCKDLGVFASIWRDLAASRLLWLGDQVVVRDGAEEFSGLFLGLGAKGCALVGRDGNTREFYSGTMRAGDGN